jgi:hypothetical protein
VTSITWFSQLDADDASMGIYFNSSSNNRRMSNAQIYWVAAGTACIVFLASLALLHRIVNSKTILDDLLFGVIAAALAIGALYRRELRKIESEELSSSMLREIEELKLRTLKSNHGDRPGPHRKFPGQHAIHAF